MFGFFRSKRSDNPEEFESFLLERTSINPMISIEEGLEQYIKKYNLAIPCSPDEPLKETCARTKLKILENTSFPDECNDPQFQNYYSQLRFLVEMYANMSPEAKKITKQKENLS